MLGVRRRRSRAPWAPSARRSRGRWRKARSRTRAPISPLRSPASPGRAAARPEKPVGLVHFAGDAPRRNRHASQRSVLSARPGPLCSIRLGSVAIGDVQGCSLRNELARASVRYAAALSCGRRRLRRRASRRPRRTCGRRGRTPRPSAAPGCGAELVVDDEMTTIAAASARLEAPAVLEIAERAVDIFHVDDQLVGLRA